MGVTPIIRLRDVSREYHIGSTTVRALYRVSLEVAAGEFVAVMGASGSGKSTLLNIVGTLDRPNGGTYHLGGEAVHELSDRQLSSIRSRRIGFVFQAFNLLPRYSARKNTELPLAYAGVRPAERRRLAEAALVRVGLGDRLDHKPTELSGGQQQRVGIARAIVNDPLLILADEPTGALDSRTTEEILALFVSLHRQGKTILLVTHEADVARHASRIITMRDGEIVGDTARGTER